MSFTEGNQSDYCLGYWEFHKLFWCLIYWQTRSVILMMARVMYDISYVFLFLNFTTTLKTYNDKYPHIQVIR
jgi:hypothetical protein